MSDGRQKTISRTISKFRFRGVATYESGQALLTSDCVKLADLIDAALAQEQAVDALKTADSWLERWAAHVGSCRGGDACECGLTAVRSEVAIALSAADLS